MWGSGGMPYRIIFGNLHAAMAILVLFEYCSCKICLNFWPYFWVLRQVWCILSAHFRLCVLRVRLIAIKKGQNYGTIVYIKNIFENGWREDAYSSSYPPGSAPGHKLQKPSKESGMFHSLGTINFVLFLLKSRVKRGAWPNAALLLNTLLALSTHNRKCANKMHRVFCI